MLKSKKTIATLSICAILSSPLFAVNPASNDLDERTHSTTQKRTQKPSEKYKESGAYYMNHGTETTKYSAGVVSAGLTVHSVPDALDLDEDSYNAKATRKVGEGITVFGLLGVGFGIVESLVGAGMYGYGTVQDYMEQREEARVAEIQKVINADRQASRNANKKIAQNTSKQVTTKNTVRRANNSCRRPGGRR